MNRIKKGDNVIVTTGKDLGKKGKVVKVILETDRVVVEGVNLRQRRTRPRKSNEKGQTVEKAMPVHASNVMPFCGSCGKGSRIKIKSVKDKKVRVCSKCGKEI